MKTIKALKTYVCAPYSLDKGETMTVPDKIGARLVGLGFAELVPEKPDIQGEKKPSTDGEGGKRTGRGSRAGKK